MARGIRAWRLGLFGGRSRSGASFVFVGGVGVGKTTTAQEIARQLFPSSVESSDAEGRLLRIQMAEFAERSSLSRLVGAPPGYLGFGQGGLLTTALRQRPGQLVVFEDIDKAHPEVREGVKVSLIWGFIDDQLCHSHLQPH